MALCSLFIAFANDWQAVTQRIQGNTIPQVEQDLKNENSY